MNNVVSLNQREKTDLLTLKEASQKYDLSYPYLYKWCVLEKEIKCYFKRGRIAISESDLVRFMDERTRKWRA
jgi:hypothetical protein